MFHGIELFQLVAVAFCAAMIFRAVSQYRHHGRTARELVAWIVIWGAIAGLAVYPHAADVAGRWLGIRSGSNAILTFALILFTYLTLRNLFLVEQLEEHLSVLTRELALRDFVQEGERHAGR